MENVCSRQIIMFSRGQNDQNVLHQPVCYFSCEKCCQLLVRLVFSIVSDRGNTD